MYYANVFSMGINLQLERIVVDTGVRIGSQGNTDVATGGYGSHIYLEK